MIVELRILSGACTGQHDRFAKSVVTLGRHPLCDFRFDPTEDLDVSARHAELRASGARVTVRDTGSTNGTFVNGERINREQELTSGDVISLGELGPKVRFTLDLKSEDVSATVKRGAAKPTLGAIEPATRPRESRGTTQRLIAVMTERVSRLQTLLGVSLIVVIVAVLGAYWLGGRSGRARAAEVADFTRRIDSLQTLYASNMSHLSGQVVGLDSSFFQAQQELQRLRAEASRARVDESGRTVATLRSDVALAATKQRAMLGVDYTAIFNRNAPAVVLLAVEWPSGKAFTGSGFAVSSDGTIVTCRHLMQNESGEQPKRIGVLFNDTKTWLPAHLVRTADSADVAIIKVDSPTPTPAVAGLSPVTSAPVGAGVAIIGFPLGIDLPMEESGAKITARSTLGAGTVAKSLPAILQIDAYAAEGSSGSPVFDANGKVVGVVYGGARESGGRIVYATPGEEVIRLLGRENGTPRR